MGQNMKMSFGTEYGNVKEENPSISSHRADFYSPISIIFPKEYHIHALN